jgi:hypothetical protein
MAPAAAEASEPIQMAGELLVEPRTPSSGNASAVVQREYLVTPAAGKRILIASRVFLSGASGLDFLYGAWSPDTNPFSGEPDEMAVIKKASGGLSMVGRTVSDASGSETSLGFSFVNETFIDICVILHETTAVEFLIARNDNTANGTWFSLGKTSNISNEAMRPSFAVQTASSGFGVIRSMYVHEEEF